MVSVTMATSGMVFAKAGADRSTALTSLTLGTDMMIDLWIVEGESIVNAAAKYNFTDAYSTLNADVKYILQDAVSSYAAIKCVLYDFGGYEGRSVAEDLINVNRDNFTRCMTLLKSQPNKDFINSA